jgi:glycosyltransferase involved in cell wall biosynthesis
MSTAPEIILVNARQQMALDNIHSYSQQLARAISAAGTACSCLTWVPAHSEWTGSVTVGDSPTVPVPGHEALGMMQRSRAVILQYNPFAWGRYGVAPSLVALAVTLRASTERPLLGLMEHEQSVHGGTARLRLMRTWQQGQLALLRSLMDRSFVSTETWVTEARPWRPAASLLPASSNLPDRRDARSMTRSVLGIPEDAFVLAAIGGLQGRKVVEHLTRAVQAVSEFRPTWFLHLGIYAEQLSGLTPNVKTVMPGTLPPEAMAEMLSAADLYLAAIDDGVATRRTSFIAALQMGLPVVGTDGPSTGPRLRGRMGVTLVPSNRSAGFGQAAIDVVKAPEFLLRRAQDSRDLYDELFSWPSLADRVLKEVARGSATVD